VIDHTIREAEQTETKTLKAVEESKEARSAMLEAQRAHRALEADVEEEKQALSAEEDKLRLLLDLLAQEVERREAGLSNLEGELRSSKARLQAALIEARKAAQKF
jgi:hypothetical protein